MVDDEPTQMTGDPCPAGCEAPTIAAPEGTYYDEVWDEEHKSAWQCTRCGRIYDEDRYGEPVRVWPIRVEPRTSSDGD